MAAKAAKTILFTLLLLISSPNISSSHISPSPAPSSSNSLSTLPSASPSSSPSPSNFASPPSPVKDSPTPSPSTSPVTDKSTPPAPAPSHEVEKASAADVTSDREDDSDGESGGSGMSGGKKVGIAFGVIAAVAVVGLGALVYKRRQENIRRSRYGYNARMMEMV